MHNGNSGAKFHKSKILVTAYGACFCYNKHEHQSSQTTRSSVVCLFIRVTHVGIAVCVWRLSPSHRCLTPPSWVTPCNINAIYTSLKSTYGLPATIPSLTIRVYLHSFICYWAIPRRDGVTDWLSLWIFFKTGIICRTSEVPLEHLSPSPFFNIRHQNTNQSLVRFGYMAKITGRDGVTSIWTCGCKSL